MTISKARLEAEKQRLYDLGLQTGSALGRAELRKESLFERQTAIVEITKAASELAIANAKLGYALSRITDKLL